MDAKKTPRPGRYTGQGHSKIHTPSIAQAPIELILPRLERVRETGAGRWMASCPCEGHACGDRNRSLSLREIETGDVLLHCFAGHGADEVARALGLELSKLFAANAARGESGRPRVPRIPWGDVFAALEFDLRVMSLAFGDLARGVAFKPEDAQAIAKRAMELADTISEVKHGRA